MFPAGLAWYLQLVQVLPALVAERSAQIHDLCERFRVRKLELFGSAAKSTFDPVHSDLDFLVEFDDLTPRDAADRYFGLSESLEALFGRQVDLVDVTAIRNPLLSPRHRRISYGALCGLMPRHCCMTCWTRPAWWITAGAVRDTGVPPVPAIPELERAGS